MSAILAGKECKICKGKWYVSLGHPEWYDRVVKKNRTPCNTYKRFVRIAKSGICPSCLTGKIEPHSLAVETIRLITYGRKIKRR